MAQAQGSCPVNYLSLNSGQILISTQDPVREIELRSNPGICGARYDLIRGEVWAGGATSGSSQSGEAGVSDDYTASGAPPGTPFTLRARLSLTAQIFEACGLSPPYHCSDGYVVAILREGPSNEAYYSSEVTQTSSIEVTIQGMVGVPFRIFASADARGRGGGGRSGSATLLALIDFIDLPAGSRITSCQGYQQDAPVAARPSTWGRLKSVYR